MDTITVQMTVRITILEADWKYPYPGACTIKLFTAIIYGFS